MESAIKMGGRIPLRPQQKEGVIIHVGSTSPFSTRLIDLQEEVKPLYKIASCSFKRTSVQTIIENAGFKIDWCAFRIVDNSKDHTKALGSEKSTSLKQDKWEPMAKSEVPERNYIDELAFVIAIPGLILTLLVALLSAVLCFYNDKIEEIVEGNATVQMVQYSPESNQPITTLKSLKDPSDDDHSSLQSQSPNNSYRIDGSPRANSTLRPRPPPYKPPNSSYKNDLTI
ncbi:Epsilon-sarcoglycan [Pseudolycoriella hygida]|uniref:Epsilon-sarcoglycan n=1 Tax=Pseudolycoriella hygida TaxID=35572 RepID=A0A9Q0NAB5_9DIPT|nr:Epsilon-sarcoglycan [Pseudolycoriella hygida]